ncbi:hypothetical protein MMC21_006906 [Puttea exsequens]|nr:hypothetical protein [Puttea exsequens]
MAAVGAAAGVIVREAAQTVLADPTGTVSSAAVATSTRPACMVENDYDGRLGLRVSAIFVILVGSLFGAVFPVYASRHKGVGVPESAFFVAKYFGSGVIIATAFIHLLAPACDALTNACLTGPIIEYDWAEGIALMTIFVIFFIELMAMRFATFGHAHTHDEEHSPKHSSDSHNLSIRTARAGSNAHVPGEDHLGHTRDHISHGDDDNDGSKSPTVPPFHISTHNNNNNSSNTTTKDHPFHTYEDYAAQITAICILEFGVIFHSIFIGLTLAVTPATDFTTLYVVLVFHQTFEGLGLGSRLAATPWPPSKSTSKTPSWTPYLFALGYGLSTPLAIAAGLGVRKTYLPGSQTALIVNGVFDSISAGILIYTGLVELMAHEFMFSAFMRRAPLRVVMRAFGWMGAGAGLMALLGKWA